MTSAAGAPSAHPAPRGLTLTPRRPIAALVAALLLFGACQGDNLFQTRETGGTVQGGDVRAPKVEIRLPAAGATIAARDSVLVEARLTDNVRLASVELVGLALRGSATLGTDTAVTRFSPKTVTFQGARRDTVVLRYLLPTAEAIAETVHIIVSAKDAADNVGADTVQVAVQGVQLERDPPRVDIRQPVPGATFPAGDSLLVEVRLRDASGLVSADLVGLAFRGNPTLGTDSVVTRFSRKAVSFAGALKDTVLFRYLLPTADNTTEQVRIIVSARDTLGNTGADTVQINVDRDPPRVDLQLPTPSATFPAGDSVLVEVRLRDGSGLDSARIVGVSFRGDASLGTDTVVTRLLPKAIGFEKAPRDTVVRRYLLASADSSTERVHVIASAQDIARNVGADTVQVVVGGPRVEIVTPKTGQAVQAGQALAVKLSAADQSGVSSLQLDYSGVTSGRIVWSFSPAQRSVVRDTAVVLPAGVAGSLSLSATAQNALGVSGVAPQVSVSVLTTAQADTSKPFIAVAVTAPSRMELTDSIRVTVTVRDNDGGSGISRIGVTPLGVNTAFSDTLAFRPKLSTSFATPRTGSVVTDFYFTPSFRVDTLALPDTLVFFVHAFALDASGNCAAGVLTTEQRLTCTSGAQGDTVAPAPGQRADVVAVRGRTIRLPDGGTIADAAVDTSRQRLYLSNFTRNKVELLKLDSLTFSSPGVLVGSQPWGLSLNTQADTLLVANSGGTNISFVSLAGTAPQEDVTRRLRTPNLFLLDVKSVVDEAGRIRYEQTLTDFSDRPQFLVQDSRGQLLYSTVPTGSAPTGTIRRADPDPDPNQTGDEPEVYLLFKNTSEAADNTAITDIDSLVVFRRDLADSVEIHDHALGFPNQVITSGRRPLALAIDTIRARGSNIDARAGAWDVNAIGMSDTTFLASAGDRNRVAFGEGATAPTGRIIIWDALTRTVSATAAVVDLVGNASERVLGVDLNQNGSLGVARGQQAVYFFTPDLRLQGLFTDGIQQGAGGAAFHPSHNALAPRAENLAAFVGTARQTIKIIDTVHFFESGEIHVRDNIAGPLKASLALPSDNGGQGRSCLGDNCVVVKLYGVTSAGGVVIVNVRRRELPKP